MVLKHLKVVICGSYILAGLASPALDQTTSSALISVCTSENVDAQSVLIGRFQNTALVA